MQISDISDTRQIEGEKGKLSTDPDKPRLNNRMNKMEEDLAYAEVRCNDLRKQLEYARKAFQNAGQQPERPITREESVQNIPPIKWPTKNRSQSVSLFGNSKYPSIMEPINKKFANPRPDIAITLKRKKDQSTGKTTDSSPRSALSADKVVFQSGLTTNSNRKYEAVASIGDNKKSEKRSSKTIPKNNVPGKIKLSNKRYQKELGVSNVLRSEQDSEAETVIITRKSTHTTSNSSRTTSWMTDGTYKINKGNNSYKRKSVLPRQSQPSKLVTAAPNLIELYHNEALDVLSPSESNFTHMNKTSIDLKAMDHKKKIIHAKVRSHLKPTKPQMDGDHSFTKRSSDECPKTTSASSSYISPGDGSILQSQMCHRKQYNKCRPKTYVKTNYNGRTKNNNLTVATRDEGIPNYDVNENSPHEALAGISNSKYKANERLRIELDKSTKRYQENKSKELVQPKIQRKETVKCNKRVELLEEKSSANIPDKVIVPVEHNKIKEVTSVIKEFNFRQIPFVVAKSINPSHNLGLNIQQVLSIIKTRTKITGISPTLAHNMGLNEAASSELFKARQYRQKKKPNCHFLDAEEHNIVSDNKLLDEIHDNRPKTRRAQRTKSVKSPPKCKCKPQANKEPCSNIWDVQNVVKSSERCTCYPRNTMNYNQVLNQFLNDGEQLPSFLEPPGENPTNTRMKKNLKTIDNASVMMNILTRDSETTKKIKQGIRDLYGEYQELTAKEKKLEKDIENGLMSKTLAMKELNALRQVIEAKEHKVNLVLSLHERMTSLKNIRTVMYHEQNAPPQWLPPATASVRLTKLLRNIQNFQEHLKTAG